MERATLFKGEMVRAILDGRKTQTRRVIKPFQIKAKYQVGDRLWVRENFYHGSLFVESYYPGEYHDGEFCENPCGFERVQDFFMEFNKGKGAAICDEFSGNILDYIKYSATDQKPNDTPDIKWEMRPSIFMPKWAARIWLEVTEVRVQRVQEISIEDAKAEGIVCDCLDEEKCHKGNKKHFKELWDSINAKRGFGWDVNPWVFAYTFKRV